MNILTTLLFVAIGSVLVALLFISANNYSARESQDIEKIRVRRAKRDALLSINQQNFSHTTRSSQLMRGIDLLNSFSQSNSTSFFLQHFIMNRNYSNLENDTKFYRNPFLKILNGYPELKASFNVPSFDCFLSTQFNEYFKKIKFFHDYLFALSYNTIRIIMIPSDELDQILYLLNYNLLFLEKLVEKAGASLTRLSYNADTCKFIASCSLKLKKNDNSKFSIELYFKKLATESVRLDAIPKDKQRDYSKYRSIIYKFNEIKHIFQNEHLDIFKRTFDAVNAESYDLVKSEMNEFQRKIIKNIDENYGFKLFEGKLSITDESLNETISTAKRQVQLATFYDFPNTFLRNKIEFVTFIGQTVEYSDITAGNFSIANQLISGANLIDSISKTYSLAKTYVCGDVNIPAFRFPALTTANHEMAEILSTGNDKEELAEYRSRKDLIEAIQQYYNYVTTNTG